ncbi:MAG: glycoside hydrolase family 15 protein [Candidatus Dormibacteraeota bacterium]|nr:glycoside hydrolase family 15 protein [Candidatus Dormibacteraeota bacterium]
MTQHAIGDHALLADGRTAALIDPAGNVVWLCWPRFDSDPCLFALLDEQHGGVFAVRPADGRAAVLDRSYIEGTLVLRTTWRAGSSLLHVDDALRWDAGPQLLRRLQADGGPVEVECRHRFAAANAPALRAPGDTHDEDGVSVSRVTVEPHAPQLVVAGATLDAGCDAVDATAAMWRNLTAPARRAVTTEFADSLLGAGAVRAALLTAATVLIGLRSRDDGMVAAPTTSLPQWPGTSRTWDYRYCWLRDTALAGVAMCRLGLIDDAMSLGTFLGELARDGAPPTLVRIDGTAAPPELMRDDIAGYQGNGPVRIGNNAMRQVQLDVPGELVELATALGRHGEVPPALRDAVRHLAGWTAQHWREPDHGIWEIRGAPRHYSHSRVMAWFALDATASMIDSGLVGGDAAGLRREAEIVRAAVLHAAGDGPLQLHAQGDGADAALSLLPLLGFAAPDDPLIQRTLDLIEQRLDHHGLLDRHEPEADINDQACGPFLFPTFWMAAAAARCGRDPSRHLLAAMRACGPLGLFGEVADPEDGAVLGNYPQAQSHAACVLALTPW